MLANIKITIETVNFFLLLTAFLEPIQSMKHQYTVDLFAVACNNCGLDIATSKTERL